MQCLYLRLWVDYQSIAILYLILFLMSACNHFMFHTYVTKIYWTSTEVFLVAALDSAVPSSDYFEQINVFSTSSFNSARMILYCLICSMSAEGSLKWILFLPLNLGVLSSHLVNQYMVHGFDSISFTQFPAMICSALAESSLNRVAHTI